MKDLLGSSVSELEAFLNGLEPKSPRFRAAQLARWIYDLRTCDFDAMSDLPGHLRDALKKSARIGLPRIVSTSPSPDGSEKYLMELMDGVRIEAVFIPDGQRVTICVSSQAGCAVDCVFCVTGRMGAGRNLSGGEIAGQYFAIAKAKGLSAHRAGVVFMGMGEPLLNVPNVLRALEVLEREVSLRRITLSTSGHAPGLLALATRPRLPNLAVSLSAPDDALRDRLMPINKTYPLAELFEALSKWPLERGRRITFEYVLIAGVNDAPDQARRLALLVRRLPSKVNLIPLNESREWFPDLSRPTEAVVNAFAQAVASEGVLVTVRWSKGLAAEAACGQLKGREAPLRRRSESGVSRRLA